MKMKILTLIKTNVKQKKKKGGRSKTRLIVIATFLTYFYYT